MPGISPVMSAWKYRPSMMLVTTLVESNFISGAPGNMVMVFLHCHVPTLLARNSCILPGVAEATQACMSAAVQPGGSCIMGWLAAPDMASFKGSAASASDATTAASARADRAVTVERLKRMVILPYEPA